MKDNRKRILVSACLLGAFCRYDGGTNEISRLTDIGENAELIPFCPEIYGGLKTPRLPAEIRNGSILASDGTDVSEPFRKGAAEALAMAERLGCGAAILKERSPSCGSHMIYDGTFSGKRIPGMGVTARLLSEKGILIFSEEQIEECRNWLNKEREENRC